MQVKPWSEGFTKKGAKVETTSGMRALDAWFSRIATGQLRLPKFQRFQAWGTREVTDLLQTVMDELPAGAALTLAAGNQSPFKYRTLQSAPEGPERVGELLLDGQQRLTALCYSGVICPSLSRVGLRMTL